MNRAIAIGIALLLVALAVTGFVAYDRGQQIDKLVLARDAKYTSYAASLNSAARFITDQAARSKADHATIATLRGKLDTAAGVEQDVRKLARDAELRAQQANAERDTALANIQKLRRDLYAQDPDSAAWARAPVPAAAGDQLRQQWEQAAQRGVRPPSH